MHTCMHFKLTDVRAAQDRMGGPGVSVLASGWSGAKKKEQKKKKDRSRNAPAVSLDGSRRFLLLFFHFTFANSGFDRPKNCAETG